MEILVEGLDEIIDRFSGIKYFDNILIEKAGPLLEEFKDKIQQEQLSGRPGLNIQSGTLFESFNVEIDNGMPLGFILGTDVEYAEVHQYDNGVMPKRLNIIEEFIPFVEDDLGNAIEEAFREAVGGAL